MLLSLHIENIAVIRRLDLDLSDGLTVITGETGAGKSIVIDSIGLLLGARQSKELIRSGEESATVSGILGELPPETLTALAELGLTPDEDGLFLVSRTVTQSGKSTAKINNRTLPLSLLRDAMKSLIGIHGQHDNLALLDPENHIGYLDAYADLSEELASYRESYDEYRSLERQIRTITENERDKAKRLEFLRFQVTEIVEAKLKAGEEEALLKKRSRLQNLEKINSLSNSVDNLLRTNEKGTAALEKIKKAIRALDALSQVVPEADGLSERLNGLTYELEDIAETAAAFADESEGDPTAALDQIESRLDKIAKLERKYGADIPEVLAYLAEKKKELENFEQSEEKLADLLEEQKACRKILDEKAARLSERRKEAARKLSSEIVGELAYLDMPGVGFSCEVKHCADYTPKGADDVIFLVSTNKGEPLKPLSAVASGGELSRMMLAVKSVLSDHDRLGTIIFDEVDTGVSGKTSQKIGIKLKTLAKRTGAQIFSVTHSAQIAALADHHLKIEKKEKDDRVETSVFELDREGRVSELARIMGGIQITEKLRETAREMLDESQSQF